MKLLSPFLFSSLLFTAHAEDVVCTKKMSKVVTVADGDIFSYETQSGEKYQARTKCKVTYMADSSCPSIKFSCSEFDLANTKSNCKGGDKLNVIADGKSKKFCQNTSPSVTATNKLKVVFSSNKKVQSSGAVCTVECVGGSENSTPGTTAAPVGSTASPGSTTAASSNNEAYCTLDSGHTMCKYQGPSESCATKTIFRGLSQEGKRVILERHNELRRKVAKGQETGGINPPQPAAANMRKLVWNTELEEIAQRWADQCTFGHDKVRTKLDGTSVGQNLFMERSYAQGEESVIQSAMADAAQDWYDEVSKPGFDSQNIESYKSKSGTGHYTQVVWADTEEIGCAVVYFKNTDARYNNLIVCNYATAGNFIRASMYQTGAPCSACPVGYTCDDGLCAK